MPSPTSGTDTIDPAAVCAAFARDGLVHLPGMIAPRELAELRADADDLIAAGPAPGDGSDADRFTRPGPDGAAVFHRVQYLFPKGRRRAFLRLLGHPLLLALVDRIAGEEAVVAGEAMVFKLPGRGAEVPVHADCDPADPRLGRPLFNLDVYLDDATPAGGCLEAAPGSQRAGLDGAGIAARGFAFPGLRPYPVRAGDVLVHDLRLVHGSRASRAPALRRTLYFEFQPCSVLERHGGPRPEVPAPAGWIANRRAIRRYAEALRAGAPLPPQPDLRPRLRPSGVF